MSVELAVPCDPRKVLRVPEAGAPWHVDAAASSPARRVNEAVLAEKVASTCRHEGLLLFSISRAGVLRTLSLP